MRDLPAVEALENARRDVRNAHKADEGRLRISAPTWLGKTVLPPILSGFRELYPKMCFEISLSDGLVNIVDDDYDLAIRISSAPSDKFTIWRKIRAVPRILVAAPVLISKTPPILPPRSHEISLRNIAVAVLAAW